MHAVAAGAVGGNDGAALGGEAVIAIHVAGDALPGKPNSCERRTPSMAAGADVAGEIALGDGGVGIAGPLDGVNAVAVGADGR